MSQLHPSSRYIWMRHTATDGASYVAAHLVWDADKFIAEQTEAVKKVNADAKPGTPRLAKVEQITEEQYSKERACTKS